jgi:hypothetical protein
MARLVIEMLSAVGRLLIRSHTGAVQTTHSIGDPVDPGLRVFREAADTGWDPDHVARAWAC